MNVLSLFGGLANLFAAYKMAESAKADKADRKAEIAARYTTVQLPAITPPEIKK
mgnify:FL=1